MGIDEASCLTPNIGGRDTEISKNNSDLKNEFSKNYLLNSYQSVDNNKNSLKKNYINKIILIQKFVRFFISRKKFNDRIELLSNIIELDSPVNLIKDKSTEIKILSSNKGELLSNELISKKKIIPYENTLYYKKTINYYKENQYLRYTPLIYIDKYKNSNLYKGTWTLEKIFHGYGIFYVSGNKYEGFWHFGKLTGECRYFLQNNDYFIGNFKDGQAEGKGKYYHNDGTIYEGEWVNDQPSGKGKEIFVDGSIFDGIFENGVKKKGLFKWNDGSYYDGEIKNNVFDGKGKFHWKEGREYQGSWIGGKMWGEGVMKYLDGAKYEGHFLNGKREGFGKYIWNKKKYYEGEWKIGKQDGKGYFFNKGKGIHAIWKDGNIINYLNNDNRTTFDSSINGGSISNINRSIILSQNCSNNYNDSLLSLNQSNNSGIDKIILRMKTTQNKYKNVNYELNDFTKRKAKDISKNYKYTNNTKKKKHVSFKENETKCERKTTINHNKNKKNSDNKSVNKSINRSINRSINMTSQITNNSLMINRERISIKIKNEMKKLNQTQDNMSHKGNKKIYRKKK